MDRLGAGANERKSTKRGITMKAAVVSAYAMPVHQRATEALVRESSPRFGGLDRRSGPPVHLTPRQREVLSLLCEGLPNKLICRRLNISTGTVKIHIGCIMRELGVSSRLQAVVSAQRCGLLLETAESVPQASFDTAAVEAPMMLRMLAPETSRARATGKEGS
jgi:DNA-binding CsgD family transcriptional regulator